MEERITENLINLIKLVELDIRSQNNLSKNVLEKLTELSDWDYKIVQDAILRIRMAVANNDLNFVYKFYENNIKDYTFFNNNKKLDLLIATLKRDKFDTVLTDVRNRLYIPDNLKFDVLEIWGLPVTQARNLAVKEAMKNKAKYLMFVDDDIVAPNNSLLKLYEILNSNDNIKVVAANYYKKIEPLVSAHNFKNNKVILCAMGFVLMDIDYISKNIPFPLFWEFGSQDGYWLMGEDAFFTNNFYNYCPDKEIFIDNSIKLLHYDKIWKRSYGERDIQVTYATNWINDINHFERLRVPEKYPLIAIAIPTRTKDSPIAVNLDTLLCYRGYRTEFITVSNLPVDQARTYLVDEALKMDASYILFIDDDVVPPINGLNKLITNIEKDGIDIISGDYPLKEKTEKISIHLQLDSNNQVNELERSNVDTLFKSNWLIGLGFVLIDIRFFKQARRPWFLCHTKHEKNDKNVNEDAHFSELAFENGFNIWVDRSIKCLHLDFEKQQVYSFDDNYNKEDYAAFLR